eukprot:1808914-Amphidinium_carterae.2
MGPCNVSNPLYHMCAHVSQQCQHLHTLRPKLVSQWLVSCLGVRDACYFPIVNSFSIPLNNIFINAVRGLNCSRGHIWHEYDKESSASQSWISQDTTVFEYYLPHRWHI